MQPSDTARRARGPPRAIEKFSGDEDQVRVVRDAGRLSIWLDGRCHRLTPDEAARLRVELGDALERERVFTHTTGRQRPDGSYVVTRRGADSSGHRKVFGSFAALERRFHELPETFTATDLDSASLSGGRRHMVLRHLVEHPAFDCRLVARQPLTASKRPPDR